MDNGASPDDAVTGPADAGVSLDRIVDRLMQLSPVARHWGIEVMSARRGAVELAMTVREDMSNTHGACHGGVIFSLADSCFGFAANSYDERFAAASCEIRFLAPARTGDRLVARAAELWKQGRSGLYDVAVTNQKGDMVAVMRGHARLIGGRHLGGHDGERD